MYNSVTILCFTAVDCWRAYHRPRPQLSRARMKGVTVGLPPAGSVSSGGGGETIDGEVLLLGCGTPGRLLEMNTEPGSSTEVVVGEASPPVVMVTVLMTVSGGTVTTRVTVTVAPPAGADFVVVVLGCSGLGSGCSGSGEST